MGISIASLLILSTFFTGTLMMFRTSLFGDRLLSSSFESTLELREEQLRTRIAIGSTTIDLLFRCETEVKLTLDNVGDVPIWDYEDMDFIQWYIPDAGDDRLFKLAYTGGNLDKGDWAISSISGDSINPGILDPGETANLTGRLKQPPKQGELGYVTLVTPNGVSASAYVDFEDAITAECFYLHNNPTPPTGHTDRQATELPWGDKLPAATNLYNYDDATNAANEPGLTLHKTNKGITETSTDKYQVWRSTELTTDLVISGDLLIDLFAAPRSYNSGDSGIITLFLRDYDPGTGTYHSTDPIAKGTVFSANWQAGVTGDFVERAGLIRGISHTVVAGREVEAKMVVENESTQEMWVAYDTLDYSAKVNFDYDDPTPLTSYYLHNDPTPPTDHTDRSTGDLLIDTTVPTGTTLYNYDDSTNSSNEPGLALNQTAVALGETDTAKFQVWRTGALGSDLLLSGDVIMDIWAATKNYQGNKAGAITMYLRDYNGSTWTEIGNAGAYDADWQGSSGTFVGNSIIIPSVNYTISAGNELEVRMMVDNEAGVSAMWLAYDTTSYLTVLKIP